MEGGPPVFRQDCTCPALLKSFIRILFIWGCHPLRPGFPAGSDKSRQKHWPRPRSLATTDGVSLMSFPPGTEMFQFPGFALIPLFDSRNKSLLLISVGPKTAKAVPHRNALAGPSKPQPSACAASVPASHAPLRSNRDRRWVSPFGDSRIKACSRLPMTYRSVPRPSSPLSAKASTRYP